MRTWTERKCPHCSAVNVLCYYQSRGKTCCECGRIFDWDNKSPKPTRPSWDDYFFDLARFVSKRATCPRASIGVVLVDNKHRIISTGYNGAASQEAHCTDVGCEMFAGHCVRARHAERNAVDSAIEMIAVVAEWDLQKWDSPDDIYRDVLAKLEPTAYVVGPRDVCSGCARLMHLAGVKEVKVQAS